MQFKAQEAGTDDEILQFCQANYGVTFPIAKKVCASFESLARILFRTHAVLGAVLRTAKGGASSRAQV